MVVTRRQKEEKKEAVPNFEEKYNDKEEKKEIEEKKIKKVAKKGVRHESGITQAQVIREFKAKLKRMKKPTHEKVLKIAEEYRDKLLKLTDAVNSVSKNLSVMNMAVKKTLGNEYHKITSPILKPSDEDKKKQIADNREIYMERLQNRTGIDYQLYIQTINLLRKSNDYYELCACVNLVTGRRSTEITFTGRFEYSDDHHVKFYGQLKANYGEGKEEEVDDDAEPYIIPLIEVPARELISIHEKLRAMNPDLNKNRNSVVSKTNAGLNKILTTVFGAGITSEIIRGVYVDICYKLYGDEKTSIAIFGRDILGHSNVETYITNYARTYAYNIDSNFNIKSVNTKIDQILKILNKRKK